MVVRVLMRCTGPLAASLRLLCAWLHLAWALCSAVQVPDRTDAFALQYDRCCDANNSVVSANARREAQHDATESARELKLGCRLLQLPLGRLLAGSTGRKGGSNAVRTRFALSAGSSRCLYAARIETQKEGVHLTKHKLRRPA